MRAISDPSTSESEIDQAEKPVGAVAESPFLADAHTPDWFQQLVYELSAGEIACPHRNVFLRELRIAVRAVQSYEVLRRWALIGRIVRPRTGLLALATAEGAELDDLIFGLVDFVCDLREADRMGFGWEPHLAEQWRKIVAAAPETAWGLFRVSGAAPLHAFRLSQTMASDAEERWVVTDARRELLLATRYGALNREERQAVRGLASSDA